MYENIILLDGKRSTDGDLVDYSTYSDSLNKAKPVVLTTGSEMQRFMMPYIGTFYFNAINNIDTTSLKECIKKQM